MTRITAYTYHDIVFHESTTPGRIAHVHLPALPPYFSPPFTPTGDAQNPKVHVHLPALPYLSSPFTPTGDAKNPKVHVRLPAFPYFSSPSPLPLTSKIQKVHVHVPSLSMA